MADTKEVKRRTVKRNRWWQLSSAWALSDVPKYNERKIIEQLFVSLEATFGRVCERHTEGDPHKVLIEQIKKLVNDEKTDEKTWANAYKIEQLIIPLYSEAELEVEFKRHLLDAKKYLYPNVYAYYEEAKKALDEKGAGSPPEDQPHERVVLLSRLVKDLQWRRQLKNNGKEYARSIRIRSGVNFIFSVVIFVGALFLLGGEHLLYLAMACGFIGASFSVLINLKKRLAESKYEELKVTYQWSYIFTRGFIGLGAALIFFYFLKAEMLQGPAFPDVAVAELLHHRNDITSQSVSAHGGDAAAANQPADGHDSGNEDHADDEANQPADNQDSGNEDHADDDANPPADGDDSGNEDHADDDADKERALLIIWCFLAGFSESLVPTLLKKTEEKATS